jgi:hypothetical protein
MLLVPRPDEPVGQTSEGLKFLFAPPQNIDAAFLEVTSVYVSEVAQASNWPAFTIELIVQATGHTN